MAKRYGNYDGKRQAAIVALLSSPTLEEAANRVGIAPETLWRWLREDSEFSNEYRLARREAVSHAVARLCAESSESVKALMAIIRDPKAPATARVKAIEIHLNAIMRFLELDDLGARVEALEKQAARPTSLSDGWEGVSGYGFGESESENGGA